MSNILGAYQLVTSLLLFYLNLDTKKRRYNSDVNFQMAGVAGLEPTHAGFRNPCLTNLAIPLYLIDL